MSYEMEYQNTGGGFGKIDSKKVKKFMPFIVGGLVLGVFGFMMKNKNHDENKSEVGFSEDEDKIANNVAGVFNQQQQEYTQMLNQLRMEESQHQMELSQQMGQKFGDIERELINSHTSLSKNIEEQNQDFQNKLLETTKHFEENNSIVNNKLTELSSGKDNTIVVKNGGNNVETRKRKIHDYKEVQNKMHSDTYKNYEHDFLEAKRRGDEHEVKKIREKATAYVTNS